MFFFEMDKVGIKVLHRVQEKKSANQYIKSAQYWGLLPLKFDASLSEPTCNC